jgi:NAD(P)-dependent dehydrogenase (short-subunit alcohol dehydrogenase family)
MVDLTHKVALVTGASRGIGRSISVALAEKGASLFLASRNLAKLRQVEKEIRDRGGRAVVHTFDLAVEQEIIDLFQDIQKTFGRLDIAVHNAGVGYFSNIVDVPMIEFDKIMQVNLRGTFLCCQQSLKLMIPQGSGYIINISSMQGIKAYPKQSVYAASKHGIMGISKALAAEAQKHHIRVSVILPGAVDTELIGDARPDLDRSVLIYPEDISKTVLYLLSLSERAMVDQVVIRRSTATPF